MLFDVDGTLVTGSSSERGFTGWLFRHGRLGPTQWIASLLFLAVYLPRFGRDIFKKNKAYLTGLDVEEVAAFASRYVRENLIQRLNPASLERLRRHLAEDDEVVLLTGAPDFIAGPLAAHLGVASFVASVCPRRDGRFAFGPPAGHPFGAAKLDYAKDLARTRNIQLEDTAAYADSRDDLPLLHAVGTPIAVRPDTRLRNEAATRGWEIIT